MRCFRLTVFGSKHYTDKLERSTSGFTSIHSCSIVMECMGLGDLAMARWNVDDSKDASVALVARQISYLWDLHYSCVAGCHGLAKKHEATVFRNMARLTRASRANFARSHFNRTRSSRRTSSRSWSGRHFQTGTRRVDDLHGSS